MSTPNALYAAIPLLDEIADPGSNIKNQKLMSKIVRCSVPGSRGAIAALIVFGRV